MRITLGNIDGKALGLNASEACVYAAIEKCSKGDNAKGWYGTMDALAGVLPFKVGRVTVSRAIAKLLTMGIVRESENKLLANVQNEQNNVQNEHENVQNERENVQNELPPNNPPINNKKMNEEIKEQPRADMRTRDGASQQCSNESVLSSFGALGRTWIKISGAPLEFKRREISLWKLWNETNASKRQAILNELNLAIMTKKQPEHWKDNPYFFVQDFPEPEPKDYNGAQLLPDEPLVIAKYNDRAGLYTRREAELFGMNILRPFNP